MYIRISTTDIDQDCKNNISEYFITLCEEVISMYDLYVNDINQKNEDLENEFGHQKSLFEDENIKIYHSYRNIAIIILFCTLKLMYSIVLFGFNNINTSNL